MANADTKIADLEAKIGLAFTNKLLGAESLQMAGAPGMVTIEDTTHIIPKNTRLAVLGDAVMASVLCSEWYNFHNAQGTYPMTVKP
jgi:hypothetical protein